MIKLFELVSTLKTPLALGGIIVVAMFLIYKTVLKKEIFPKLTKVHSFNLLNKLISYFFYLALVALVLGICAYIFHDIVINSTGREIKNKEESGPVADAPKIVDLAPLKEEIFLIAPPKFPSSTDKERYSSSSVSKDFSVIHFTVEKKKPFPIIKFTLMNGTEKTQIITRLKVIIHEFDTGLASPNPLVLKPLIVWDIKLPYDEGTFEYIPNYPVLIPSDNAASISLRLFRSEIGGVGSPNDVTQYVLKFVFVCAKDFEAETPFFVLWNGDVLTE